MNDSIVRVEQRSDLPEGYLFVWAYNSNDVEPICTISHEDALSYGVEKLVHMVALILVEKAGRDPVVALRHTREALEPWYLHVEEEYSVR